MFKGMVILTFAIWENYQYNIIKRNESLCVGS